MAPPFPLCCLTGLVSADAAGTAAAFFTGLASGGALTALSQVAPKYADPQAPLAELLADHKQRQQVSRKIQKRFVVGGLVAAAAAAGINKEKEAAVPLALSATLSAASVTLTVFLIRPLNESLEAAAAAPAGKKAAGAEDEAATRGMLRQYVTLSTARTAIATLAFGSALCGVLLLNKKK
ncbi:hypothetical protein ABPG75_003709 [Micractinium tetrahymenae]